MRKLLTFHSSISTSASRTVSNTSSRLALEPLTPGLIFSYMRSMIVTASKLVRMTLSVVASA